MLRLGATGNQTWLKKLSYNVNLQIFSNKAIAAQPGRCSTPTIVIIIIIIIIIIIMMRDQIRHTL